MGGSGWAVDGGSIEGLGGGIDSEFAWLDIYHSLDVAYNDMLMLAYGGSPHSRLYKTRWNN